MSLGHNESLAQTLQHSLFLAPFVGLVRIVSTLIKSRGFFIDNLEFDKRDDDSPLSLPGVFFRSGQIGIHSHGEVYHEVERAVGIARKSVPPSVLSIFVVTIQMESWDVLLEVRVLSEHSLERHQRVFSLPRDNQVKGEEALGEVVENRQQVLPPLGHHPEPGPVVDLGGNGLLLRQQLGDKRVLGLDGVRELRNGQPFGLHLGGNSHHPLHDEFCQLRL
ncbi:hypothetical protein MXAN_4857 [Myxococcus xanthus DK 1622]|uniref:Uncharacterized protein n=1 Tax=Myxococcus xanthus (strain DK1622) TaxID=246197 RepID=Q1D2V6_MYXXD|nr:hypothetical protein MXAN_4857 [Myxococcus xanthus DK 1622]